MCLMKFVCYPSCGHTEYFIASKCDFVFNAETQSCSKGANELRCVDRGTSIAPHCPLCYEAELIKVRAEYMEMSCGIVKEAGKLGLSRDEVKGELDEVLRGTMRRAGDWKVLL